MKCLICGEKTKNKLLCEKHASLGDCLPYLTFHICRSFAQKKGEPEGVCEFHLLCEPIKRALKREVLIDRNIGHVICPHAQINLGKAIYLKVSEVEIKNNYPECLD